MRQCAVVLFVWLLFASLAAGQVMRVHFIDVGQGAPTLFELLCDAVLVGTGGEDNADCHSTDALAAYLNAFFADHTQLHHELAGLILTHPHMAHTRGAEWVRVGASAAHSTAATETMSPPLSREH
jgi:beta-lactamase superfamily II metal-dependent hydrolase